MDKFPKSGRGGLNGYDVTALPRKKMIEINMNIFSGVANCPKIDLFQQNQIVRLYFRKKSGRSGCVLQQHATQHLARSPDRSLLDAGE